MLQVDMVIHPLQYHAGSVGRTCDKILKAPLFIAGGSTPLTLACHNKNYK